MKIIISKKIVQCYFAMGCALFLLLPFSPFVQAQDIAAETTVVGEFSVVCQDTTPDQTTIPCLYSVISNDGAQIQLDFVQDDPKLRTMAGAQVQVIGTKIDDNHFKVPVLDDGHFTVLSAPKYPELPDAI